jgi:hypothetical protein
MATAAQTESPVVFNSARAGMSNNPDRGQLQQGFAPRVMFLLERSALGRRLGLQFGGKRDLYASFGWPTSITVAMLQEMYNRGGIAKRIAHAYPDATWGRPPRIYLPVPKGDVTQTIPPAAAAPRTPPTVPTPSPTPPDPTSVDVPTPEQEAARQWTRDFAALAWDLDLWDKLKRADVLSNLGRFSIILIGTNRGALDQPIPTGGAGKLEITYLQPYSEQRVQIKKWDMNPRSVRFGMPELYTITPISTVRATMPTITEGDTMPQGSAFDVHWSRVIHITQGTMESEVYGVPIYGAIWNYLEDLMKVVGSSSESYWKNSYPGLHMNVDPAMDLAEDDEINLTAEMDEFQHEMRRYLRTRGVDVKAIGASTADPRGPFSVLVDLIAGTTGTPKRILLGSESGQLASSQDKASWAEKIEEYRELHAEPRVLWPFVMWVINNKVLPLPAWAKPNTLRALWPDAYRMSPLERGQTAAQTARSLANITKGMQPIVLEEAVEAIPETPERTDPITGEKILGSPGREGKDAVTADPLINRDEARRIIGLSTDQAIMAEFPEDGG